SMESTQSLVARSRARFFCGPKPGQSSVTTTLAPILSAMSRVASVLPESTTTISSANATDSRHSAMCAASFKVMMMTETLARRTCSFAPPSRTLPELEAVEDWRNKGISSDHYAPTHRLTRGITDGKTVNVCRVVPGQVTPECLRRIEIAETGFARELDVFV